MARKGFTLMELMVVIIIIGILATLGLTQYGKTVEKARGAEAKQTIGYLRTLCGGVYMEKGDTADCNATTFGSESANRTANVNSFWKYDTSGSAGTVLKVIATRCLSSDAACKAPFRLGTAGTITYSIDYNSSVEGSYQQVSGVNVTGGNIW